MAETENVKDQSIQLTPGARYSVAAHIAAIPSGRVRCFFASNVVDTLARMERTPEPTDQTPLMAVSWPMGTDIGGAIEFLVQALARLALARWPDWYGECAPFCHKDGGEGRAGRQDGPLIERLGTSRPTLNRPWAERAIHRCRGGEPPTLRAFTPAVQVRQLALALAQPDLVLLLAMNDSGGAPEALHCFARAAAWFAGESGLRVATFVPEVYRTASELDAISYNAIHLENPRPTEYTTPPPRDRKSTVGSVQRGHGDRPVAPGNGAQWHASGPGRDEPLRLVVPPILGRPHPASPGEQLLALWLARDVELASLFTFNQRVDTTNGASFIVDLLWRGGKLTVEVDGYGWHSSPHAFAADRHRDYCLLCEGYRTLRLPHDEVMADPALQCEKIRDVVRTIWKEK